MDEDLKDSARQISSIDCASNGRGTERHVWLPNGLGFCKCGKNIFVRTHIFVRTQEGLPVKVNGGSTDYENSIRLDELQRSIRLDELQRMKDSWITWRGDFYLPTAVEDRIREIRQDWKNCQEAVPPYYDRLTEGTSETCNRPMPCSVHEHGGGVKITRDKEPR